MKCIIRDKWDYRASCGRAKAKMLVAVSRALDGKKSGPAALLGPAMRRRSR